MKAIILAGGYGKRLLPLTKTIPKPLIKINGQSVIKYNINLLKAHKFQPHTIIVSLLYKQDKFYSSLKSTGVVFDIQDKDLGTAGAIAHAKMYFKDPVPFVVLNGDTVTNINLFRMAYKHFAHGKLATVFSQKDAVNSGGTYVFSPQVLRLIPEHEATSIHKDLIPFLQKNDQVEVFNPPDTFYFDIGTPNKLARAKKYFEKNEKFTPMS